MKDDTESLVREIVKKILREESQSTVDLGQLSMQVPAEISARHIHLSQPDLEKLFGSGYHLTPLRELSQPGQFAARETVRLIGSKGVFDKVRVLGPCRTKTQIEISRTDSYKLGVPCTIRLSGDLTGSPGILVMGPNGYIELKEGVILSKRHLHIEESLAVAWGLTNGQVIKVGVKGSRGLIFDNVIIRTGPGHKLALHLDTDEGNAANLNNGDLLEIIKE